VVWISVAWDADERQTFVNTVLNRKAPSNAVNVLAIGRCLRITPLIAVAQLIEALRYKREGRGLDSRWCHLNFSLT
jgi:hypothetical protein